MKRTKAFFLTILAVMGLCSCGESTEVKPVKLAEDYKTPAEFTINGTEYVASFTREGADMWECEITAPETVVLKHQLVTFDIHPFRNKEHFSGKNGFRRGKRCVDNIQKGKDVDNRNECQNYSRHDVEWDIGIEELFLSARFPVFRFE